MLEPAINYSKLTNAELAWVQTLAGIAPTAGRIYVGNGTDWTFLNIGSPYFVIGADGAGTALTYLDKAPRGTLVLSTTGGTTTLTSAQFQNMALDVTGALTSNATIVIPDGISQMFIVDNATTGAFTLTVKNSATAGVDVPQGTIVILYTSGTKVEGTTAAGGGGAVISVFGRVGAVVAATGDYTAAQITNLGSISGMVKGNGAGVYSAATSGTDYSAGTSALATGILKNTTGTGSLSIAVAGTDYLTPTGLATGLTGTLPVTSGGTGTSTAFTAGSIIFAGAAGVYSQNNAELFWDNTHFYLGIGTATPSHALDVHHNSVNILGATNIGVQSATAGSFLFVNSDPGAAMLSGNRLGGITIGGSTDAAHTIVNSSILEVFATENWSGTAAGSNIVFSTTANTTLVRSTVLTLGQDKSAVFTGAVTIPSPFTLGATSVTTTGVQLNYLNIATGTTGTASVVYSTSPTLITPTIGVASATSVNKITITAPATGATLTLVEGSTLATSGAFSTTLTATAATNVTLPTTGTLATLAGTETLTNKRVTERVSSITSSATPTPNADTDDDYIITAQAVGATFGAPTGTPTQGQSLIIRIKDNATAQTLAFNAIYRAGDVILPTTTIISKTMYLGFKYNSTDVKWDFVSFINNF